MATIGLVAEGPDNLPLLETLIERISPKRVTVRCIGGHGEGDVLNNFPTYLDILCGDGTRLKKALIVRDLGTKNKLSPNQLRREMQKRIPPSKYPFTIHSVVAVKELEAWLLADERALSKITGKIISKLKNPEKEKCPKQRLTTILSQAKEYQPYTPQLAQSIAENLDINAVARRCPSFSQFKNAILDC